MASSSTDATEPMNIQLSNVLSDITGLTGLKIIRAIVAGQRGSGRQGRNPAGGSPAVTIVRFSHVAIPQFRKVTICSLRGV